MLLVEENTLPYQRDTEDEVILVICQQGPGERPASPLPVWLGGIAAGVELIEFISARRARLEDGCLPLVALPSGVEIWPNGQR